MHWSAMQISVYALWIQCIVAQAVHVDIMSEANETERREMNSRYWGNHENALCG